MTITVARRLPQASRAAQRDLFMFFLAAELSAARAARERNDGPAERSHVERAHVISQPLATAHVRTHLAMLAFAFRRRDAREVVAQLFRLIVAAPGSLTHRYPNGNPGFGDVGAFTAVAVPPDLASIVASALPIRTG